MRYMTARQMVFQAYHTGRDSVMAHAIEKARVGADIQLTSRPNNDALIVHGLEAGAVISRIEAQPAHLQGLLRYCFGPFTTAELAADATAVSEALYQTLLDDGHHLPGQGNGRPSPAKLQELYALCQAALYHHREITWPYRREGLSTAHLVRWYLEVVEGVTVSLRPWARDDRHDWQTVWHRALRVLGDWEGQGLAPVAALIPAKRWEAD